MPVSGIYPIAAYMAEHWLYVPSIGLFLLLSYGLCSLYRARGLRTVSVICMAGLAVFYGGNLISVLLQLELEHPPQRLVVISQQYSHLIFPFGRSGILISACVPRPILLVNDTCPR